MSGSSDVEAEAEAELEGFSEEEGMLGSLPADFVALILCKLPPREVARTACVSRAFRAASSFDSVWAKLALAHLPNKYTELLLEWDPAGACASKRQLFQYLCSNRVFFDDDTQGFWLDCETGGICLGFGARAMYVEHGDDAGDWSWLPDHYNSLFPEVARVNKGFWFEAKCETECCLPAGKYTLAWRLLFNKVRNWRTKAVTFTMSTNDGAVTKSKCFLDPRTHVSVPRWPRPTPRLVEHGWREFDVGEFEVKRGDAPCRLKFSMKAGEPNHYWTSGLCLDGVVVRPAQSLAKSYPESQASLLRFLEMNDQQPVYNHRFRR